MLKISELFTNFLVRFPEFGQYGTYDVMKWDFPFLMILTDPEIEHDDDLA